MNLLKNKYFYFIVIPFVLILLVSISYYCYWGSKIRIKYENNTKITHYSPDNDVIISKLTGMPVNSKSLIEPTVIAVSIDNHFNAVHVGVNRAAIVYEFPVEGTFSRFLAIYEKGSFKIPKVGPVRSARDYFFDTINEYDLALYMHSGGSPKALSYLRNTAGYPFFNGDEFAHENNYWRDYSYKAPHNLFTNSDKWNNLYKKYEKYVVTTNTYEGWKYGGLNTTSTQDVSSFTVPYGYGNIVVWRYDERNNKYNKYVSGVAVGDDIGQFIADNVIVQFHYTSIVDNYGRLSMQTIGEGDARVFRDGKMIYAKWKKKSSKSKTRYYDENGKEVNLKAGNTWVMFLSNKKQLSIAS